jgi:hypothetical protein
MGKRELLIVAAFVAFGAVAWQLTAPPPPEGGRRFSVDTVAEIWRNRNSPSAAGRAVVTTEGTIAVGPAHTDIRLANLFSVIVEGEDRSDIAWRLDAEATGPTDDAARDIAARMALQQDDLGTIIALSVRAPEDTPRSGTLTLQVPARLLVRVESARRVQIGGVYGVRLENLVGDVTLSGIKGPIDGSHRNGELTIDDPLDLTLALAGSRAVVRRARGAVSLSARNGSTLVADSVGPIVAEVTNQHLTISTPGGNVRAGGIAGEITIDRPRASIDVDARRTHVSVTLDRPVPATIFSTEGRVTVSTHDITALSLDVRSDAGEIEASAVALTTVDRDGRSVLTQTIDNAPRLAIRGERSRIVITSGK